MNTTTPLSAEPTIGDPVPYMTTASKISWCEITEFVFIDGKKWYYGIDARTDAKVYRPLYISVNLLAAMEEYALSRTPEVSEEEIEKVAENHVSKIWGDHKGYRIEKADEKRCFKDGFKSALQYLTHNADEQISKWKGIKSDFYVEFSDKRGKVNADAVVITEWFKNRI
jgi:hypothetical protein